MTIPTITQTPGQWPRAPLTNLDTQDLLVSIVDQLVAAVNGLAGGGGSTPVAATFSWGGTTLGPGGADSASFAWPTSGLVTPPNVVAVSYSGGLPAGVVALGNVVSNDHVQVTFFNLSGTTQVLAAGTVRFVVS